MRQLAEAASANDIDTAPHFLPVPACFRGTWITMFLLGGAGVLALILYAQAAVVIAAMAALPSWLQILSWTLVGIAVSMVTVAAGRLIWLYLRLRRVEQIPLATLQQLDARSALRRDLSKRRGRSVSQLREYVCCHPLALDDLAVDVKSLKRHRQTLLDHSAFGNHQQWLTDYRDLFQKPLDDRAHAIVHRHARRAAWKIAASPNALMDTAIACYHSLSMLGDLCRIYNVRTGRAGTITLLAWLLVSVYMSGHSEQLEDQLEETLDGWFDEASPLIGFVAARAGARVVSATCNFLLLRRLGRAAIRRLQPLSE